LPRQSSTNGTFLHHEPCPSCGSKDAGSRYDNGDLFCFVCDKTIERGGKTTAPVEERGGGDWTPLEGEYIDLPTRSLKKATLAHWDYKVNRELGVHIANFYDADRRLVAQKVRGKNKTFKIIGNGKNLPLYGQWLYNGGKHLVITEGEIDALSMSQVQALKWPVVSLPNGAQSAEEAIENAYEWLDRFDRIVLMFDMDKPGREAAAKVAPLLPPGKAAIAVLPRKDANEVLCNEGPEALVRAFWDAPLWVPDGIIDGAEITLDRINEGAVIGLPFPYPKLQDGLLGMRKGELTLWTAGSGIGKSTIVREMLYYLHESHGCYIGNVFLEENNVKTAQGYVAIDNNVPLGMLRHNPGLLTDEQKQASLARVVHQGMWFYNHFGSLESKKLITRLRYLATVRKVDFIGLDHISIVTSGLESSSEGERKDIDILMTRLRQLIEETGVGIHAIVHLKRVTGKSFNEGAVVSLSDLRGSGSLEQLSDNVIALERNQQSNASNRIQLRVLKCRETGASGEMDVLNYNKATGRLELAAARQFNEDL
jgi:twinkle protein